MRKQLIWLVVVIMAVSVVFGVSVCKIRRAVLMQFIVIIGMRGSNWLWECWCNSVKGLV